MKTSKTKTARKMIQATWKTEGDDCILLHVPAECVEWFTARCAADCVGDYLDEKGNASFIGLELTELAINIQAECPVGRIEILSVCYRGWK